MGLLWTVTNGLQMMTNQALFFVKFPANANFFNSNMVEISSFDFLPVDIFNQELFFFPDEEPISLNFQEMGFTSSFTLLNLGSIFYMILFYIGLILLNFVLYLTGQFVPCAAKLSSKLYQILFWGGLLRFWMEIYLDVGLAVTLNMNEMGPSDGFTSVAISNGMTYGLGVILILLPIWIAVFYSLQIPRWADDDF